MKLRHRTKRFFTAALAVWLSGIVVLFCCGAMPSSVAAAEVESCPLAKKGVCAKTAETDAGNFFEKPPPPSFDCCAFPAKIFDKNRKSEKTPEAAAAAPPLKIAVPRFFPIETIFKSPKRCESFVRNRGGVYLRNCILRI